MAGRGRGEFRTGFWSDNLKERGYLEEIGVDGKITFEKFLRKQDWKKKGLDLCGSGSGL